MLFIRITIIVLYYVDYESGVVVHGPAGTGKTILANQLAAFLRSKGKIVLICASTTLAASNYKDAETAHYLSTYPVVNPDDDDDIKPHCRLDLSKNKKRLELLMEADVIIWDECFGNHKDLIEAFFLAMKNNKKIFWVFIGDTRQCLPIIKYGSVQDIIDAVFVSSFSFKNFEKLFLTDNKRLQFIRPEGMSNEIFEMHSKKQREYEDLLLLFGSGIESDNLKDMCYIHERIKTDSNLESRIKYVLPEMNFFLNNGEDSINKALEWLYDGNYNPKDYMILTVFNERVDFWNNLIQSQNVNESFVLKSHDYFADVDDDKKILSNMLSTKTMNYMTNSQVPNHEITLKVGDICFIMRPLRQLGLASNTRVQIVHITKSANGLHPKTITVKTLDEHPRIICIPRINFQFKPRFKSSYNIVRIQFPLKLAYAITNNKSMGQTTIKTLYDITGESFSHGQAYVGLSRNRIYYNLRFFINELDCIDLNGKIVPTLVNCLYPSILMKEENYKDNQTPQQDIINHYDCNIIENEDVLCNTNNNVENLNHEENIECNSVDDIDDDNNNYNDYDDENDDESDLKDFIDYTNNSNNNESDNDSSDSNESDNDSENDDCNNNSNDNYGSNNDSSEDHNKKKNYMSTFEEILKTQYNFNIENVAADGNCFFHSIVDQLSFQNNNHCIINHYELRQFSAMYMQSNRNLFENYFENINDLDEYIDTISQNCEWADNYIIQALCNEFNFNIYIYCDYNPLNPIQIISVNNSIDTTRCLHIGYMNRSHYVSLIPIL